MSKLAFECHTSVKMSLKLYYTLGSNYVCNLIFHKVLFFSGWMHTYFRILGFETCSVYWKATCQISIWKLPYLCPQKFKWTSSMYNISHEICTQFLCAWFYCDCIIRFCWIYVIYFFICFKCDTPALGQSCDYASKATLEVMGKSVDVYLTTTKRKKSRILCIIRHTVYTT